MIDETLRRSSTRADRRLNFSVMSWRSSSVDDAAQAEVVGVR